ncbi:hypothetical protein O3M35_008942 [Rhynocoris fuscipes]|uniref:Uncharacterized protein n=1 Tax=Rhynocoris fuscipes TaxID=488301 RepID=A0AAW1D8T2_9HEMI
MTSLYTYLNIKFLPCNHMLFHNIMSYHNFGTNENTTLLYGIVGKLSTSTF